MARVLWIADYLHEDGLNPAVVPGWEKRGRDGLDAVGVLGHHIGISGGGEAPGLQLVTYGHGRLAGNALCNVHQGRSGRPTVVASGVAWHAGLGGLWGVTGNSKVLGVEAEGTVGEYMADRQYDMFSRIAASLLRGLRRETSERFACHHHWRAEKPDAWALIQTRGGIASFRARLSAVLHPVVVEEDEMRYPAVGYMPAEINADGKGLAVIPDVAFDSVTSVMVKANDDGSPADARAWPWKGYGGMLAVTLRGTPGVVGLVVGYTR